MRRALSLAVKGMGCSSPNPPVGCVIVQKGKVVGRAWHDYGRADHAEIVALRQAGSRARGATVYVSLEPCCHHGRTPPCTEALIAAGVRRVVAAAVDPNPRVSGKGLERLRTSGILIEQGLFQDDAKRIIEPFACHATTGRPLVTCKVGMTLDGKIGSRLGKERQITSPEAGEFSQFLRLQADALVVGVETIKADDPELTYRGGALKRLGLIRVILDSHLRTPERARIFGAAGKSPVLIFCHSDAPASKRRRLEHLGAEVVAVPGGRRGLSLRRVLSELSDRGVIGVLVEGGSRVHGSFLAERLVDKFYFMVAPVVIGGADTVPCVGGDGYREFSKAPRFKIHRRFSAGPDLILETYPSFSKSMLSPWSA